MIKVYCDRCGKKLNTDDPHYYPLGDAANGDDIFFAVSVYNKSIKRTYESRNDKVREVDDSPNFCYDYNAPDLCPECMRVINQAVKTVWDGKNKVMVREIYGVCDDAPTKLCANCRSHYEESLELCESCNDKSNWTPKKTCQACKYRKYTTDEEPCKSCCIYHTKWEHKDAEK